MNKTSKARKFAIRIIGSTPLLLHYDNISWSERMKAWASNPANRDKSLAGDDRTPAYRWAGCLYEDNGILVIPADNIMTVIREGAKRCPLGRGKGTFKSQSQSGIIVDQAAWPILVDGKTIPFKPIQKIIGDDDSTFEQNEALAASLGFTLFVKRAKIGMAKHVRVRPRFDTWESNGTVTVLDDQITDTVVGDIFVLAGMYSGLGDWRPSSPKSPGPFGKFNCEITPVK